LGSAAGLAGGNMHMGQQDTARRISVQPSLGLLVPDDGGRIQDKL
jgi:hypothetical protein